MIDQSTRIVFNKQVAEATYLMGLASPEMVKEATPGQFVMLRVRSGIDPLLRRPFSICGIQADDIILILYRVVGEGTSIMAGLKEGERVSVLGPLGKGFELPEHNEEAVLVAGGIGIAPLIFLAQTLEKGECQFFAGFGSANEVIDLDQIGYPQIKTAIATDDGTLGHAGFVTDLLESYLKDGNAKPKGIGLFSCGPKPMLRRIAEITKGHGVPCQVSLESNMACGLGACLGCAVKASVNAEREYQLVCQQGPVFPVEAIDWGSRMNKGDL